MTDDEMKRMFEAMRQEDAAAHADTRRLFQETADRLAAENQDTRRLLGERVDQLAAENAAAHEDTRRHFDVALEGNRHEIRLVAEKVQQLDEKLDRECADIRQEMRLGFAETQAMIKFSYAELDRRVRTLEETQRTVDGVLEDLQSRVERLERSTH